MQRLCHKIILFVAAFILSLIILPSYAENSNLIITVHADDANARVAAANMDNAKIVYATLHEMGCSDAGIAGFLGNISYEDTGFDPAVVQGMGSHPEWDNNYVRTNYVHDGNATGFGISQWTYYTRVDGLLKYADEQGKKWCDISVQASYAATKEGLLANEVKSATDPAEAATYIMYNYEQPAEKTQNNINRRAAAGVWMSKIQAGELTGGKSAVSGNSAESSDATKPIGTKSVVSEDELTGMPKKPVYTTGVEKVALPDRSDFSVKETDKISNISSTLELEQQVSFVSRVRSILMTLGYCILGYGILLFFAYVFDRVNSIFEWKLVTILTLGRVKIASPLDVTTSTKDGMYDYKHGLALILFIIIIGAIVVSEVMVRPLFISIYSVQNFLMGL